MLIEDEICRISNSLSVNPDIGVLSMCRANCIVVIVSLLSLVVGGCTSVPERALSRERTPYAALTTGKDPLNPDKFVSKVGAVYASNEGLLRYYEDQRGHPLNILLLSGGGQNEAFVAGLLKGWRESGTRPEIDMVTGVSTGALLATHAFLGTPAKVLRASSALLNAKVALAAMKGERAYRGGARRCTRLTPLLPT